MFVSKIVKLLQYAYNSYYCHKIVVFNTVQLSFCHTDVSVMLNNILDSVTDSAVVLTLYNVPAPDPIPPVSFPQVPNSEQQEVSPQSYILSLNCNHCISDTDLCYVYYFL